MSFELYQGNFSLIENVVDVGLNFQIRSYCDDATVVYLTKPPLCKLTLTPRTQGANLNIAWDISNSRAPTGTIDTFTIQWGGPTDIGDLIAVDFGAGPTSGNVQYTSEGRFTVRATVIDTLGVTGAPCRQVVQIGASQTNIFIFIVTDDSGVWFYTQENNAMVQRSNGLTGAFLEGRGLVINPLSDSLPLNQVVIWIATLGGPAFTIDGGLNWSTILQSTMGVPVNDAGDSPAPAIGDLEIIDVMLNPVTPSEVSFLLVDDTDRTWVYTTTDGGASFNNVQARK